MTSKTQTSAWRGPPDAWALAGLAAPVTADVIALPTAIKEAV